MTKNKKVLKLYIISIIMIALFGGILFASGILISKVKSYETTLRYDIEQSKRTSARYILQDTIDRFDTAILENKVNPNDIVSVSNWAKENFSIRNGSDSSDGFIIELGSEQFVYDESIDCSSEFYKKGRYMKDEAKMHYDKALATKILNIMREGNNTKAGNNYYWKFNPFPEWLEWKVYPPQTNLGLNGQYKTNQGIKNPNYKKYLFVLGTQSDEIFSQFDESIESCQYITKLIYIILSIILISFISTILYITYVEMFANNGDENREGY